jgi:hypothetical protein
MQDDQWDPGDPPKLYDACQPLRDIIAEHPELEEEIVTELGKGMTQSFAGNFYAGMKP